MSILSCVTDAREGARTLRDTISAEMWESVNTFQLLARASATCTRACARGRTRSTRWSRSAARCSGGSPAAPCRRTSARAFLQAGGRIEAADMVLRMLRVALPPNPSPDGEDSPEAPRRDGNALALLRAVGGFQAFMRSAAAPPNAAPVARFMLYEREFPDSVAASASRSTTRSSGWRRGRRTRRPCCACGACWPTSTSARGWRPDRSAVIPSLRPIQQELGGSTPRSTTATSTRARSSRRRCTA